MFIRYHLFYYALAALLTVLAYYHHNVFFLFLFIYLYWLYKRKGLRCLILASLCVLILSFPRTQAPPLSKRVQGRVTKVSATYCYVETDVGKVKLIHNNQFQYGDYVDIAVKQSDYNRPRHDNDFDEQLYLLSQNIVYKARLKHIYKRVPSFTFYHWMEERLSTQVAISDYQRLFLMGEKTESIQEDYQGFVELSLVHLLALSGMHIHILYGVLKKFFAYFFNRLLSQWITYGLLSFYIFSIPMNISLYRAFFVLLLYQLGKRWFHKLDVLSFLILVVLFNNPYIIYNISFVFSYFIYFVIIVTQSLKLSSLFIYLSSLPIVLNLNYRIPLLAFFLGDIFLPFIKVFYCMCWLALFSSRFEIPLLWCVEAIRLIMTLLEAVPLYWSLSKPTHSFVIMFYSLYFRMIYQCALQKSKKPYLLMTLALMIAFSFYGRYKIYAEITMIDVGQGDCTLIRLPMNKGNILIDTGGHPDYDVARKTLIPYFKSIGIHTLDYVYISHNDTDHNGALASLVEHFPVTNVIDKYEPERMIGDMKVTMLQTGKTYDNDNDQSLILFIELYEQRLLFMGDASLVVEDDLRKMYPRLDVDILKVAHHGSVTSTSAAFLTYTQPQIAMIGVKKNNLYGHPSALVMDRLKRRQIKVLRTDIDGMFHIRFYGKSRYIFK